MKVSVVIPAYNEEASIVSIILGIKHVFGQTDHEFEIVVVDDASTDATRIKAESTGVKVLSHKYNKGYGRSIKDGIAEALFNYVLILDGDGQHNPQDIPKLLRYAEEFDMVVGARKRNGSDLWRLPGKWLLEKICNYLSKTTIPDVNSGFRIFKKQIIEQYLHLCSNNFSFTTSSTLAFLADERDLKYVEINIAKREYGRSRVSVTTGFQTLLLAIQIIMVFDPLRFFLPFALIILLYGCGFSFLGIVWYHSFPRTGILTILAGIIIFCFGLLADQIARLRRELQLK